jgi:hypothetical protein
VLSEGVVVGVDAEAEAEADADTTEGLCMEAADMVYQTSFEDQLETERQALFAESMIVRSLWGRMRGINCKRG